MTSKPVLPPLDISVALAPRKHPHTAPSKTTRRSEADDAASGGVGLAGTMSARLPMTPIRLPSAPKSARASVIGARGKAIAAAAMASIDTTPDVPAVPARPSTSIRYIPWKAPGRRHNRVITSIVKGLNSDNIAELPVERITALVDDAILSDPANATDLVETMLDDWLQRYEAEQWSFSSLAVYGELKLTEAIQLTAQLGHPNDFVTALACSILDKLTPTFGPYAELVRHLAVEMHRAIYVDYEAVSDALVPRPPPSSTYADLPTHQRPKAVAATAFLVGGGIGSGQGLGLRSGIGYFRGTTYFTRVRMLRAELKQLELRREDLERARAHLSTEMTRRKFVFNTTVRSWQRSVLRNVFREWKTYVRVRRKQLEKYSKMFQKWWGGRKAILWQRFHQWKDILTKKKRNAAQKQLRKLRERLSSGQQAVTSLTAQVRDTQTSISSSQADLDNVLERNSGIQRELEAVTNYLHTCSAPDIRNSAILWSCIGRQLVRDTLTLKRAALTQTRISALDGSFLAAELALRDLPPGDALSTFVRSQRRSTYSAASSASGTSSHVMLVNTAFGSSRSVTSAVSSAHSAAALPQRPERAPRVPGWPRSGTAAARQMIQTLLPTTLLERWVNLMMLKAAPTLYTDYCLALNDGKPPPTAQLIPWYYANAEEPDIRVLGALCAALFPGTVASDLAFPLPTIVTGTENPTTKRIGRILQAVLAAHQHMVAPTQGDEEAAVTGISVATEAAEPMSAFASPSIAFEVEDSEIPDEPFSPAMPFSTSMLPNIAEEPGWSLPDLAAESLAKSCLQDDVASSIRSSCLLLSATASPATYQAQLAQFMAAFPNVTVTAAERPSADMLRSNMFSIENQFLALDVSEELEDAWRESYEARNESAVDMTPTAKPILMPGDMPLSEVATHVAAFAPESATTFEMLDSVLAEIHANEQVWHQAVTLVQGNVWTALTSEIEAMNAAQGKVAENTQLASSVVGSDEFVVWTRAAVHICARWLKVAPQQIPPHRLSDIVQGADEEMDAVNALLRQHSTALKGVYRSYGASGAPTLDGHEFLRLIKDSKVMSAKISPGDIHLIFLTCNRVDSPVEGQVPEAITADKELTSVEFAEALVRVAVLRATVVGDKGRLTAVVAKFLEQHVLALCASVDPAAFRSQLQTPEVQAVMALAKPMLKKLFNKYSAKDGVGASPGLAGPSFKTMSKAEWLMFCKDMGVLDAKLPQREAAELFSMAQHENDDAGDAELTLPEFLEAVCAVAAYRSPDPFISLDRRLATFLRRLE